MIPPQPPPPPAWVLPLAIELQQDLVVMPADAWGLRWRPGLAVSYRGPRMELGARGLLDSSTYLFTRWRGDLGPITLGLGVSVGAAWTLPPTCVGDVCGRSLNGLLATDLRVELPLSEHRVLWWSAELTSAAGNLGLSLPHALNVGSGLTFQFDGPVRRTRP